MEKSEFVSSIREAQQRVAGIIAQIPDEHLLWDTSRHYDDHRELLELFRR